MNELKAHLFVCTSCTYNCLDGTESSPDEAYKLRKNLKARTRELFSKKEVRVSASTCLGECERGIVAVMYPKGEWSLGLRPSDEDKLFTLLINEISQIK